MKVYPPYRTYPAVLYMGMKFVMLCPLQVVAFVLYALLLTFPHVDIGRLLLTRVPTICMRPPTHVGLPPLMAVLVGSLV